MLKECTDMLLGQVSVDAKKFENYFRAIAGSRLSSCKDFSGILKSNNIVVSGENEQLSREIYLNCIIILCADSGEFVQLSDDRAVVLAKKYGLDAEKVDDVDSLADTFAESMGYSSEVDEAYEGWGNDDEDEEVEDEVEDNESEDSVLSKDDVERIKGYYYQFYKGVVSELAKRYGSLFESGYEVSKPAGILTTEGLVGLSGNKLIVKKQNISVTNIFNMFLKRVGFVEVHVRSNIKIADAIYDSYVNGGRRLLYFPYKLLEYAYGRKAPSGDNQDSVNTYESHANASNWSAYCKSEVEKSLMAVVGGSVVKFVYLCAEDGDYYNQRIANELQDFLAYLQRCLSLCILMIDYKSREKGYMEDVHAFKVRVCDPEDTLGQYDMTQDIIRDAFMGSTGDVPFSYPPRFEPETMVKEYTHEFNHDSSQASPLFAYKAYLALQEQNVEPTWNNMILGMFEDGTILRNGKHGVNLNSRLTHHIDAGSRAGKGVMTLNTMASAIYSRKIPFYLDRKPDMASMFKHLCKNMFVVNGAVLSAEDTYGEFSNQDSLINQANIPQYVCDMLEVGRAWLDLGDLFYMRALKLVMGIIMARGDGRLHDPNFGGDNGILLVADEFKNFQESYALLITKMKNNLPASADKYEIERGNLEKIRQKNGEDSAEFRVASENFNRSYNNETFYALSYLNSMVTDLEFLSTKRDAGFDPLENSLSDIFVIGQHLEHGSMDFSEFRSMLTSGRYKQVGRRGITGGYNIDFSKDSFGYSLVSFKTCDAFFGRNMEDGREVYLAQTNKSSKAYGRLDDKAGNFAYMSSFTDDKRRRIVSGNLRDNIELANSCVYFKPFLVLNDAKQGDMYTNQMFARCAGPNPDMPWVTPEELIRENPNADGSFLNEAVGFEGYLNLMGISDYADILAKGAEIANYVVRECLKYDGTWLDFITDLRPTALFTVKDIVEGARGNMPTMLDYAKNPVTSEFAKFNPQEFGLEGGTEYTDNSDFIEEDLSVSDFIHEEPDISSNLGGLRVDDEARYSEDEEIDIFDDEMYTPIKEGVINETFEESAGEDEDSVLNSASSIDNEIEELKRRLQELERRRDDPQLMSDSEMDFYSTPEFGENLYRNAVGNLEEFGNAEETEFNERIEFNNSVESYQDLVNLVTNDVIKRFGGLNQIVSFKVVGGSIIVNGYYYRCKVGDIFAKNIPYDLRREMNAGNIDRLFDYSQLLGMSRLRDLEFDSLTFVYDYVSYGMGYGSRVSVDLFFRDLRALQCLCIGKKLFRRETYKEAIKEDDVFYQPRTAAKFADYSEKVLGNFSRNSWEFTKNTMNSKKYGKVMKALGVTGGFAATVVTGSGNLAVKGGRKALSGLRSLGRSIKDVLNETKNY